MKKHIIDFKHVTDEDFDGLLREAAKPSATAAGNTYPKEPQANPTIPQKWKDMVRDYCEREPLNDLDTCLILLDAIADPAITCEKFVPLLTALDERRSEGIHSCNELLWQMEMEGYIRQDLLPFSIKSMKPNWQLTEKGWELVGHHK